MSSIYTRPIIKRYGSSNSSASKRQISSLSSRLSTRSDTLSGKFAASKVSLLPALGYITTGLGGLLGAHWTYSHLYPPTPTLPPAEVLSNAITKSASALSGQLRGLLTAAAGVGSVAAALVLVGWKKSREGNSSSQRSLSTSPNSNRTSTNSSNRTQTTFQTSQYTPSNVSLTNQSSTLNDDDNSDNITTNFVPPRGVNRTSISNSQPQSPIPKRIVKVEYDDNISEQSLPLQSTAAISSTLQTPQIPNSNNISLDSNEFDPLDFINSAFNSGTSSSVEDSSRTTTDNSSSSKNIQPSSKKPPQALDQARANYERDKEKAEYQECLAKALHDAIAGISWEEKEAIARELRELSQKSKNGVVSSYLGLVLYNLEGLENDPLRKKALQKEILALAKSNEKLDKKSRKKTSIWSSLNLLKKSKSNESNEPEITRQALEARIENTNKEMIQKILEAKTLEDKKAIVQGLKQMHTDHPTCIHYLQIPLNIAWDTWRTDYKIEERELMQELRQMRERR